MQIGAGSDPHAFFLIPFNESDEALILSESRQTCFPTLLQQVRKFPFLDVDGKHVFVDQTAAKPGFRIWIFHLVR